MHRKLAEKRRDDIIGQATIAIIREDGQISLGALLNKLRAMTHSEKDIEKLEAIKIAAAFIADKLYPSSDMLQAICDGHADMHHMPGCHLKKH